MGIRIKVTLLIALFSLLAGCGGGDTTPATTSSSSTVSTVNGTASTGLIKNGTVNIYAARTDGSRGTLLAATSTDSQGHYTAQITNYSGPVIIEVSGKYLDEATGEQRSIDPGAPLRAGALLTATGTVDIAVTPLTDLAYRKALAAIANGSDVATAINSGNLRISELVSINDITSVQPVDATAAALQGASADQRTYTLALAAISELAKDEDLPIPELIDSLNAAGDAAAARITTGLNAFLARTPNNQTGYKRITVALVLAGVGSQKAGGLDFIIALPAGILVNADASGRLLESEYTLTPTGTTMPIAVTKYTAGAGGAATLRMIILDTDTFSDGQVATLQLNVPQSVQAKDFRVQSTKATNINGASIAGAILTLQ